MRQKNVNPKRKMGGKTERFLTWLAVELNVAPATQNQTMNALIFLYKKILKIPVTDEINAVRSTKKTNIPVVLTREEVKSVIHGMEGTPQLIVKILYGSPSAEDSGY